MGEPSGARDSLALSNLLLCHESESSLNEEEDETNLKRSEEEQVTTTIGDEDDDEFVAELVRKENRRIENEQPTKTTSSFDRLIAIDWILTVRKKTPF